jgi:hypothetical protein
MKLNHPTSIGENLKLFAETLKKRQKYLKKDYQVLGLRLADELEDWNHKSLYIRLAKNTSADLLEKALYFVKDQTKNTVRSYARLFMWKLKQLKEDSV